MIGLYENDILIKSIKSEEKASEFLPVILSELEKDFKPQRLIYANGPGSFMGIKISFLALKTLSIAKDLPLFALSGFKLNDYKPILANKNLCFVYEKGEISLKKGEPGDFHLPQSLANLEFETDNLPNYFLPVV